MVIPSGEDICAALHAPVVGNFTVDIGPDVNVLIRRRIKCEERKFQVLVQKEVCQPESDHLPELVRNLHARREGSLGSAILQLLLQVILPLAVKSLANSCSYPAKYRSWLFGMKGLPITQRNII